MSFEDIGSVEALLCGRAGARAKTADHGALVMGQSMSILVVLSGKALLVVFTCQDGTFLWSLGLVSQHVCFQVFEDFAAISMGASTLLSALVIKL